MFSKQLRLIPLLYADAEGSEAGGVDSIDLTMEQNGRFEVGIATTKSLELNMRTLVLSLAAATALLAAVPASAQDVRLRGPGVDVDVGARHHWREHDWRFRERAYNRAGCKSVTIREGNVTKHIRKCNY
jgi:hypothetical protein